MRSRILGYAVILCLVYVVGQAQAAQTIKGTMQSGTHQALVITTDTYGNEITLKPAANAVIQRGQMGKEACKASLLDFAPGDRIVAVVNQDGTAPSIKGFYEVARGTVIRVSDQKMFLKDGTSITVHSGSGVVFGEGRIGKPDEIKPGTLILCRLNPMTKEAWTVVATEPAVEPVKPEIKPVITAITYAGPSPLKVKDWVRVDLEGTAGGRAICEVKGLIPRTVMNEVEPGKYRASVMVPGGKPVTDAALVGRLSIGAFEADPVQAAKLITIGPEDLAAPDSTNSIAAVPAAQSAVVTQVPPVEPGSMASANAPDEPTTDQPAIPSDIELASAKPSISPSTTEPAEDEVPPAPVDTPPTDPESAAAEPTASTAVSEPATSEPAPVADPTPAAEPTAPEPVLPEPPVPEPPKTKAPVVITSPANEARIQRSITISGTAEPGSQVLCQVTYTNSLGGILGINGQVSSQLLAADNNGRFSMGPIPLEGPLATQGLMFKIEASYPDSNGQPAASICVFGDRS